MRAIGDARLEPSLERSEADLDRRSEAVAWT